ncbi:hypothetical protein [Rhizobium mesosinicum]|uniref:BA14K family protein n=1 Tax=Rhizobium mesosinicum TaxID=335017 RepID=A0ABS7GNY0_9HYPH|nr:hypothetical protein [Rhizobium mesosinicum]MBW9051115.1 hypothetical protein [Rhizobium mesosinicum]
MKYSTSYLAATALIVSAVATGTASAQEWRRHYDDGPPPPPSRHHHHNNGGAIAGGVAAGIIGGLIGGALANGNNGPRYIDPPPPPAPRCWYEDRQVANAYDGGWHTETVRVCQ